MTMKVAIPRAAWIDISTPAPEEGGFGLTGSMIRYELNNRLAVMARFAATAWSWPRASGRAVR